MRKTKISLVTIILDSTIAIQKPIYSRAASINGSWNADGYDVTIFGAQDKKIQLNGHFFNLKRIGVNNWKTQSYGKYQDFTVVYEHGQLYIGSNLHAYYKLHR
ncbi:hypothetical protein [Lactobacillus sp. Sy-1]|uniref:hypothetical protein n=1 Tax=Lactobacillus sp. Sy-1 TaxID=2109645 RepID=UPI001C5B8590|nr:hypothetical protein [Lactobacillus sp. Sy-1]MBW1606365.1 hypothetical protein [Lactobacillus sp. Sy-1]